MINSKTMFKRIYNWVLHWAHTRYGTPALSAISLTESFIFPIPPDPLLMALCFGRPTRAFYFALVCSTMSVLGGLIGYFIGWGVWNAVSDFFLTYIVSPESFHFVGSKYAENAFLAILGAAVTPLPFKVFTISAGVFNLNLLTFLLASALGRSARFFLEGALIYFFGTNIKHLIEKYFSLALTLFFILLAVGFIVIKYLLGH